MRTLIRNVLYLINNRAARSFRYTILPVGSRSRLRSYSTYLTSILFAGMDRLFSYQLTVIVSLGLAVILLFSVLTIVLMCVCITHKRRIRGE